ncbi:MAG: hypothetical protein WAO58_07150 [Fimbriimonadaceae bacterium]
MTAAIAVILAAQAQAQIPDAQYADAKTKEAVLQCTNAYAKLRHGVVEFSSSRGKSTIWLGDRRVRERQPLVEWSYRRPTLSLRVRKSNRLYRGRSLFSDIPDHLAKGYGSMDPITSRLARHRNPLSALMGAQTKVKLLGTIVLAGVEHRILRVTDGLARISIYLRAKEHLIGRIESEARDRQDRVLSKGVRVFSYKGLNKPLPISTFELQGSALPLSKLGR